MLVERADQADFHTKQAQELRGEGPLVRPMIGAFLLISFLGAWNNFIGPQIILQSPELQPLSVALNNLRGVYGTDYGLIMAGTLVSIAPVMCLFLLLQREFISGLTAGAVKG
ncbi:MAG: carbohydrate ABC transporter permease [Sphingomonadales bacterium]|nr:carbohydrate ABC transporter permease [Sphingomonadales bacterium]